MNLYEQRLNRIRAAMAASGLGTLILTPGASMRYLTGFSEPGSRFLALVVQADHQCVLVAPTLNAEQARSNPAGVADIRFWDDSDGWEPHMSEISQELNLNSGGVGVDDDMPARFTLALQRLLPNAHFKPAGIALSPIRAVKDMHELAALQNAADATDALIPFAYAACRPGVSELEVSLAIQHEIARTGSELSFTPIIGAGPNGASPHHNTGSTQIKRGDIMILDFGAMADGYHGDITRTVAIGEASEEARRIYNIVYWAQQAAVAAVVPGATAHDVDSAARKVIIDAGYGEYFIHRTGHGIGLDDHEAPYILAGNMTVLQPGHCFSIEPGIYLPGKFGVRLEVIVTVTDEGNAHVFNQPNEPSLLVV